MTKVRDIRDVATELILEDRLAKEYIVGPSIPTRSPTLILVTPNTSIYF